MREDGADIVIDFAAKEAPRRRVVGQGHEVACVLYPQ